MSDLLYADDLVIFTNGSSQFMKELIGIFLSL